MKEPYHSPSVVKMITDRNLEIDYFGIQDGYIKGVINFFFVRMLGMLKNFRFGSPFSFSVPFVIECGRRDSLSNHNDYSGKLFILVKISNGTYNN